MGRIDYSELKKLESLLDDNVIDEEEYNAKVAQICSVASEKTDNASSNQGTGKNNTIITILSIACAAMLVGLLYFGSQFSDIENLEQENNRLKSARSESNIELSAYKRGVGYYLDTAVLVIDGDSTYYHRYNCPNFPGEYRFHMYNVDAARDFGYKECPDCFNYSTDDYVRKFF